jgi:Cu+-exporting ATPase
MPMLPGDRKQGTDHQVSSPRQCAHHHNHPGGHGTIGGAVIAEGSIYTCPMHPEIRQTGPGSCPICGMALEPILPAAEAGPSPELADMMRRFWIGLVLSIPVVALEMGAPVFDLRMVVPPALSNWIQFVLATPVVVWAGLPFFVRGGQSVATRNLNMFTLIAMGTGVAWVYSAVATLAPGIFPATFRGSEGAVAVYFEAAAVITVLVLLGQVLELRAREQTSGAIRALLDLAPKTARRVKSDGTDEEVPLDAIAAGDRLRMRPGKRLRSMDCWSRGGLRWTNRWSPASPCRSRKSRAQTSSPGRSTRPAASSCVPRRSAATPCWRR